MQASECHQKLDENGVGNCAVPMWCNGLPAGFCNEPAFGRQELGQERYGDWVRGRWYPGRCDGLACHAHGGPKSRVFKDGDKYCAVMPDFEDLVVSLAGFGDTPEKARAELERQL